MWNLAERWVEHAPVIVLGREAAGAVDCIHALRRGCDDYVPRPFEYQELVERIRAVLRRALPRETEVIDAPPVRIDTRTRDARVAGQRLQLAQKEYELLLRLAREPDRVFTKAELLRDVWGYRVIGRTRTARTRTRLGCAASCARREAGWSSSTTSGAWGIACSGACLRPDSPAASAGHPFGSRSDHQLVV